MKIDEKYSKKLLVEGNDDQHVVWALCEKHNICETFDIIDCQSIYKLVEQIPVRLKESGIDTIGIMIDADIDIKARWQSIRNQLEKQHFHIPTDLPDKGLIVQNGYQKVGVWIMPDNKTNGMLEDFLSFLIPDNDPLLPIAYQTLENIEIRGLDKYIPVHKPKALIHTWLAWQQNPGTPMGQSITKKYLSTDQTTCCRFIQWLTDLFKDKNK